MCTVTVGLLNGPDRERQAFFQLWFKHSGLRTFHSSATRLWNETELSFRDIVSQKRFLRDLQRKMILKNSAAEHFNINYMY